MFPKREHKPSGGGRFLKLEAGKPPIKGVFAGEPHAFINHFLGKGSAVCTGDGCPHCAAGTKGAERFKMNFIVNEGGTMAAKIFEFNGFTYDTLSELHNAGYDLSKNLVQLSKTGTGTQSKVLVIPVPNGALTPAQLAAVQAVQLNALSPPEEKQPDPYEEFVDFPNGE